MAIKSGQKKEKKRIRKPRTFPTKLSQILKQRGISNLELIGMIEKKFGKRYMPGTISLIVTGKKTNYFLETAVQIATVLDVLIDDIIGNTKEK